MKKIRRPKGLSNSPYNILKYLPDEEGFFDSRHWVWGGAMRLYHFRLQQEYQQTTNNF